MEKLNRRRFLELNMFATGEFIRLGFRKKPDPSCLTGRVWRGLASYYSQSGCIGCNANQIMADGNRFNEDDMTLACNIGTLDRWVLVTNVKRKISQLAKVTDRGGFDKPPYYRIADLSKGLKNKIGGGDITYITIREMSSIDLNC